MIRKTFSSNTVLVGVSSFLVMTSSIQVSDASLTRVGHLITSSKTLDVFLS